MWYRKKTRECLGRKGTGLKCLGEDGTRKMNEEKACNLGICPINGGWSDWGQCLNSQNKPHNCGEGGYKRRQCNNPIPNSTGQSCIGKDRIKCNNKPCKKNH